MLYTFYRTRNHWFANEALVTLTLPTLAEARRTADRLGANTIASKRGLWANAAGTWVKS
jgi:hypothetical protein